jgi:hypothetical protein
MSLAGEACLWRRWGRKFAQSLARVNERHRSTARLRMPDPRSRWRAYRATMLIGLADPYYAAVRRKGARRVAIETKTGVSTALARSVSANDTNCSLYRTGPVLSAKSDSPRCRNGAAP